MKPGETAKSVVHLIDDALARAADAGWYRAHLKIHADGYSKAEYKEAVADRLRSRYEAVEAVVDLQRRLGAAQRLIQVANAAGCTPDAAMAAVDVNREPEGGSDD